MQQAGRLDQPLALHRRGFEQGHDEFIQCAAKPGQARVLGLAEATGFDQRITVT